MEIKSINRQSFGEAYPCIVKKLFKSGAFGDKVLRGFYGDYLSSGNFWINTPGGLYNFCTTELSFKKRFMYKLTTFLHLCTLHNLLTFS